MICKNHIEIYKNHIVIPSFLLRKKKFCVKEKRFCCEEIWKMLLGVGAEDIKNGSEMVQPGNVNGAGEETACHSKKDYASEELKRGEKCHEVWRY